jgi:predicted nuclease of predicted toxin-antitoxin system
MCVLVDEHIPRMTVDALLALGHDVKNSDLWAFALSESSVLITTDNGFAEYRSAPHHGILIVRLRQPNCQRIHHSVMHVIEHFPEAEWLNLLVVVRDSR